MIQMRPTTFDKIIGQKITIERLKICTQSAIARSDALAHVLLSGPAGTGKTTIARAIANELNTKIQFANGAQIRSIKLLLPYLVKMSTRGILFIDEVHRLTKIVQEFLYTAMEDFRIDLSSTKDDPVSIDLNKFTLIGATTEAGSLEKPFIDRFPIREMLTTYSVDELVQLISSNASSLGLMMAPESITCLANRCKGVPRLAHNYLIWLRDYTITKKISKISKEVLDNAMKYCKIDKWGFTPNDRAYLTYLKKSNMPVGINTLSSALNINRRTIENDIEPFLIRKGYVVKTPKGRILNAVKSV